MADQPSITLANGVTIPQLGFGVFQVPPDVTEQAVGRALAADYRHVDTAAMYRNEAGVGTAIAKSDVPRNEVFVTSKLNNNGHGYDEALAAFAETKRQLGFDYLDLYLIHWPQPKLDRYVETWRAFEKLLADGEVRAIGVSNFQPAHLDRLAAETDVVPAINQIELHPYLTQRKLRDYDRAHGIATEAWSPLAKGAVANDSVITALGDKYGKTPAQIVLRWHLDTGNVVIPKSVTPSRIVENFDVFDFELDPDDVEAIETLNRDERTGPNPDALN